MLGVDGLSDFNALHSREDDEVPLMRCTLIDIIGTPPRRRIDPRPIPVAGRSHRYHAGSAGAVQNQIIPSPCVHRHHWLSA